MIKQAKPCLLLTAICAALPNLPAQVAPPLPKETPPAHTGPGAQKADVESTEEVIVLSPFEVNTEKDRGYAATETLAGTRIRSDLKDVASSVSVVTKEFMADIGATSNETLLQYTAGTEVAGTKGTFTGGSMTAQTNYDSLAISSPQRVRALSAADGTRDFFLSNIAWDSYNVERVDIQRGPNSILFGLGSPSGIINASTKNALFKDSGSVEARVDNYGSVRTSFDVNQTLIKNVLAIRVDALWNDSKYQQKPAFKNDHRLYGTIRWDPKIFSRDFATSIRIKAEKGSINANMPRTNTPYDSITPWYDPNSTAYHLTVGGTTNGVANPTVYDLSSNASAVNPWYSALMQKQQVAYQIDGTTGTISGALAGYINGGYRNSDGTVRGYSDGAIGLVDSFQNYGLNGYANYASNAKLQYYLLGQYKNKMLTDPSIFNFYDSLLDGNNKRETADWTNFNFDFTQNGWGDRVALNLSYNHESYNSDNWNLIGGAPTISIDITNTFQDGNTNPYYARPFVSTGGGSGSWSTTKRDSMRGALYGEFRLSDVTKNELLIKLLGRHRFNLVASQDTYDTESRNYNLYTSSNAWNTYVSGSQNAEWNYRSPMALLYLGGSGANAGTASNLKLPNISGDIKFRDTNVYLFDSTWANYSTAFNAAWTPNTTYLKNAYNSVATTQASNPANYVGWNSNRVMDIISYGDGEALYTYASKTKRVINSYAGTWQGFLFNEALVPTLGWRFDSIKTKSITATTDASNHRYLKLDSASYSLPQWDAKGVNRYKNHSVAGGAVLHLNKLLPSSWDKALPVNVSLSYNNSSNFQISSARVDVYGSPIGNPEGKTKELGVQLSTKDNKYSLRVVHFKTNITNATVSTDTGFLGTINQGLKFRNIFLYQLGSYDWSSRVKADSKGTQAVWNGDTVTYGTRWFWTPAYVDKNGRPVQSMYYSLYAGRTLGTYDHLETWDEALKHRDASITAWNNIQKWLEDKGFFKTWNYTPTSTAALSTRSEYENGSTVDASGYRVNSTYDSKLDTSTIWAYGGSAPSGFAITGDQEAKGYEFELTANVTKNWRLAFNASKTTAVYMNIGGGPMQELYEYLHTQMDGVAGDMRQYNGDYTSGNEVRDVWYGSSGFNKTWSLLKLTEGLASSELRKWKFNIITSYDFTRGRLKGFGVGAAYRWQDKVGIGYPIITDEKGNGTYDLAHPIYGPSEGGKDFWVSYQRNLTKKIRWKIQLNVSNAFQKEGLVPISVEPDGKTWAGVRIRPVQEFFVTNTFTF